MATQLDLFEQYAGRGDYERTRHGGIPRGMAVALLRARPPKPPRMTLPTPRDPMAGTYRYRPRAGTVTVIQTRQLLRLAHQARARNQRDN